MHNDKILFVCSTAERGGGNIILEELVRLLGTSIDAIIVTPPPKKGIPVAEFDGETVSIRYVKMGIINGDLYRPIGIINFFIDLVFGTISLIRLIRSERITSVHVNAANAIAGGIAALICGTPCVWQVHEVLTPRIVRIPVYVAISLMATRILAVSHSVKNAFPKWAQDKIEMFLNTIDTDRFNDRISGEKVRVELGIPKEAPVVGLIGRFAPRKGHLDFVTACVMVSRCYKETHFIMAGQSFPKHQSYVEKLRKMTRMYGIESRTHFLFWRNDIPEVTAALDVAVMASTKPEGFGLVLLEAMAMGKPVVATSVGGITDYIGKVGIIVPPRDVKALASAIQAILSDRALAQRMGESGLNLVGRLFVVDANKFYIERFYMHLHGKKRRWKRSD